MIGTTVSRYKITEKIGEGGMGSVWRAEDPNLGRDVALKFLPDALASSPEARKRFLREGKAAATLRHSGIATVYDADESDGRVYIAFELVEGETVSERIARGPLDITGACRVAFDAAEALDHAHESGVLHRDVTSRNIMIDKKGQVIVVDFGLALPQGATRVTHTGMAVGTAPYLSPEVITGGDGDARSDVYGLGVVLYEALTGHLPFDAERSESLFYLIVHTDAEPPSARREDIPPELDRIVMKALSKDPDERYGSAREFAKDLYSYLETASAEPPSARWLTAPAPTRFHPLGGRVKRMAGKPITWAMVAVVAVAIVVGLRLFNRGEPSNGGGESQQVFASVAVLPFQNLSDSPGESAWLAEGIAEALVGKLTTLPDMRVSPWFTSRKFGDMSRPLGEIANDLNVEALVVGTVRQFGAQVLCTISVVNAKTEAQWWSDKYKEPLDDLFDVQEKIAVGVARSLKGRLSGAEEHELSRPTARSVEAYEHYLKGSVLMQSGSLDRLREALPFFERALELDPELAPAHVGLGAVHRDLFYRTEAGLRDLREAEAAFMRALELDPTSVAARRGLIRVLSEFGRSADILEQGQEALRMNPDGAENLLAMGEAYYFGGLGDEAIPFLKRALELDAASQAGQYFLVLAFLNSGRYEEAIDAGETYLKAFGEDDVYLYIALAYYALGELDAAALYYDRCVQHDIMEELVRLIMSVVYVDMGDEPRARELLTENVASLERRLSVHPDHFRLHGFLAATYGMLGDIGGLHRERGKVGSVFGPVSGEFVAAALARSGEFESAADVLEAYARGGNNIIGYILAFKGLFPDGFFEHPDVQPAMQAMKALHDDLAARY